MQYELVSAETTVTVSGVAPSYVPFARWLNSSATAAASRTAGAAFSLVWKFSRAQDMPKIAAAHRIPTRPTVLIMRYISVRPAEIMSANE
jgi:hypothetical protein